MKERGRVVKAVKPSGNSGSVYVPRDWIGQQVEVRLFNAEAMVLEALYPYAGSVAGIYLYGPHALGTGTPDRDIDVFVVAEKNLPIEKLDGINFVVVLLDELEEYAKANPAEYAAIMDEAVPLMNESLLEQMKSYCVEGNIGGFYSALEKSLAIARSLAGEGDYASAAYALIQRLRDYSVLSAGGKYSYERLEDYVCGMGVDRERFKKLFGVYEAKKRDSEPAYNVSSEDVSGLYAVLEQLLENANNAGDASDDSPADGSNASAADLSREALLDRARRFRDGYGSGAA
jgi:predicted nucleotidyltransferase